MKKTSKQWLQLEESITGLRIIDPDGWDRKNYEYSFNEELITQEEFHKRVFISTIQYLPQDAKEGTSEGFENRSVND